MPVQYDWNRRWNLLGTREDQELSLRSLSQRWFPFVESTKKGFSLEDISAIPVIVLLGEPGIGKTNEIASYYKRNTKTASNLLWKLQKHPPNNFTQMLSQPKFKAWRYGSQHLTLLIDSFDEGTDTPVNLGRALITALEELDAAPVCVSHLHLRIGCRTADWSDETTQELKEFFGEDNILVVELDALGHQELVEAARFHKVDVNQFLQQIEQNGLEPLTLKPITLIDLFKEYLTNGGLLPDTRTSLYQNMCRRLCEERHERPIEFTTNELVVEASRLAMFMLISRNLSVWMPTSTMNMPKGCISIESLHYGSSQEQKITKATLQTGLFASKGTLQLGWAHLSYAEYLAASYMNSRMTVPQIKSLLVHNDGRRIVPQLREVAAWITTMNDELLDFVIELDPETLFQSDLIVEDTSVREKLTGILLDLYNNETLIEHPFNNDARFRRLMHPKLSEQLIRYVHDNSRNISSRYVAMDIIDACVLQNAIDSLATIALDSGSDYHLRGHAAYIVARRGGDTAKISLKPLIFENSVDSEDALKGAGLIANWPHHLTTHELFEALTPPKNEMFIGTYALFLSSETIDAIPVADLPIALSWASYAVEHYADAHHRIILRIQDIIDVIVYRSWQNFEVPDLPNEFALLILSKMSQYQPLFGTERRVREDRPYSEIMQELLTNHEKRRSILLTCVKLVTNPEYEYFVFKFDIPLLLETDLEWLLNLLLTKSSDIGEDKLLKLIETVFSRWNTQHLDLISTAVQTHERLHELMIRWLYVEMNSSYASAARESLRRDKEFQSQHDEIEARRSEKLLDPPPLTRLVEVLDRCEQGEIKEWWQTNIWLAANEYGAFREEFQDFRLMPNWEKASSSDRERVINSGIEYLFNSDIQVQEWFGKHVIWRPAQAAYRMLFLLFQGGVEVPSSIWQKWIPAIVAFPSFFIHEEYEKDKNFLATAYQLDSEAVCLYLRKYLLSFTATNLYFGILDNFLSRFNDCFDSKIAKVMLECLEDQDKRSEFYRTILKFLIKKHVPDIASQAISDFYGYYQNYRRKLTTIYLGYLQFPDQATRRFVYRNILFNVIQARKYRDYAVSLIAHLFVFGHDFNWWDSIWATIQADEHFGRKIIEAVAGIYDDRRVAAIGSKIPENQVADLYLWVVKRYPRDEDPRLNGWVSPRHTVSDWRDSLLNQLGERKTENALFELNRIALDYPDLYQLKQLQKSLQEYLYRETWQPPKIDELLELLIDNDRRIVATDNQLFDAVIESLNRLQKRLQGETYSAVDLWNFVKTVGICRPKDENDLSNYVKRHLEQDLNERGILVKREVEIRRKVGEQGAAGGEIPDLYVSAVSKDVSSSRNKELTVLIEVKGNWHKDLKTAAQTQLVERYMNDNDRATCGLFLVGWYNCSQWDTDDDRRSSAMRNEYSSLTEDLTIQAGRLTTDVLDIRAYVLNVSLRDEAS